MWSIDGTCDISINIDFVFFFYLQNANCSRLRCRINCMCKTTAPPPVRVWLCVAGCSLSIANWACHRANRRPNSSSTNRSTRLIATIFAPTNDCTNWRRYRMRKKHPNIWRWREHCPATVMLSFRIVRVIVERRAMSYQLLVSIKHPQSTSFTFSLPI